MTETTEDTKTFTVTLTTPPPPPAQGQIEELSYPTSVEHGEDLRVTLSVHNTGGQPGLFIARLYQGSTKVGVDSEATVQAGHTFDNIAVQAKAPGAGTSVTYTLKLFLRT